MNESSNQSRASYYTGSGPLPSSLPRGMTWVSSKVDAKVQVNPEDEEVAEAEEAGNIQEEAVTETAEGEPASEADGGANADPNMEVAVESSSESSDSASDSSSSDSSSSDGGGDSGGGDGGGGD